MKRMHCTLLEQDSKDAPVIKSPLAVNTKLHYAPNGKENSRRELENEHEDRKQSGDLERVSVSHIEDFRDQILHKPLEFMKQISEERCPIEAEIPTSDFWRIQYT